MAVLGGATSVIASMKTQNKVYTISDNSWEIVQE